MNSTTISTPTRAKITAFGLAALVTLAMLGSINGLAVQPEPDSLLAAHPAPVVVGQALPGARL